jgi:lysophospholipase L1-like esterase
MPLDLSVRFVGRVDGCDPTGVRMAWSGTGFVGKFKGTGIRVELSDSPNQYTILIDGDLQPVLKTTKGRNTYALATGLSHQEHTVEFYRRTEASQGVTLVLDVEPEQGDAGVGELLTPPAANARRIEVIGDSITCGYGDEGTACQFSPDTENNYLAYGSILARSLDAELSTVAWSGKGVYSNYGGNRVEPLPALYDQTIPSDYKHPWPFLWQPNLVVINLGTNDYSGNTDPTDTQFETAYQSFLEHIRGKYPDAYILCTNGPMLPPDDLGKMRENAIAAVTARQAAGDTNLKYYDMKTPNAEPVGCDYHPNLATQAAMAAELATEIEADLGW